MDRRTRDGFTPLQLAAYFGAARAAALLLARGAEVGAVADNPMRIQALHAAKLTQDLVVDDKVIRKAMKFLDSVSSGQNKAVYGYGSTIFLANVFELPDTLAGFLALPRRAFDSGDEVFDAGWRVD